MITVSAAVRLIPSPPALVDSKKIGIFPPRPAALLSRFLFVDEDGDDDVQSDGDDGVTWLQDEKRSTP